MSYFIFEEAIVTMWLIAAIVAADAGLKQPSKREHVN